MNRFLQAAFFYVIMTIFFLSFPAYAGVISGVYLGAYLGCGTEDTTCMSEEDFNTQTGKEHAIFSKYLTTDQLLNDDLKAWARKVPIPMIIYMPQNGLDGINYTTVTSFANQINHLDKTVFIVFGHEMNGNWYVWGQQSIKYKNSFKTVAEIFHNLAPKSQMVWVPNQNWGYPWGGTDEGNGYTEYYPDGKGIYGDYVDWVGLNFYERDYDETSAIGPTKFIDNIFYGADDINFHEIFAKGKMKPMMIAETASFDPSPANQDDFKNNWISQLYNEGTLKINLPYLHAICYFHVAKYETIQTANHTYNHILAEYRIPLHIDIYKQLIQSSYFLSKEKGRDFVTIPLDFLLLEE